MSSRVPRIPRLGGAILGLLVAGTAVRFAMAALHHVTPISDFENYHLLATTLAQHGDYSISVNGPAEIYWPPGWPFVLSLAYWIFGSNPTVGELLAAALSSATLIVTALLATRLLNRPFAIFAVAVLALNPAWIIYTSVLGTEHLAGLLAVSILALVVLRPLNWRVGAAVGLLEALLILTRADIGFVMLVVLVAAMAIRGIRVHWRFGIAAGLAIMVGLTPWVVRNEARFGEFIPTSANGGTAFYLASYNVNGNGLPEPDPPPPYTVYEDPRAYDNYYWEHGLNHVRDAPVAWMRDNATRLSITWWHENGVLFWANVTGESFYGYGADWIWRVIAILAALAGIAALAGRVSWRQWLPVFTAVIGAVIVITPFVPDPRRHISVVAPLALLAGLGAQSLYGEVLRLRGTDLTSRLRWRPRRTRTPP